jgi:ribose transport system ATP-binding protein
MHVHADLIPKRLEDAASKNGRALYRQQSVTRRSLLRIEGLSKRFPGVQALDGVDFELRAGEVHAILGENGAGKSTLAKVLAGSLLPDGGRVILDEQETSFKSAHDAAELGIRAVFQELSLVPQLTVAENLFLGREMTRGGILQKRRMVEVAAGALARIGARVSTSSLVGELSRPQRHLVEIAKATTHRVRVLILDEPTAALTSEDARHLFELCAELKRNGVGIVYITHRFDELYRFADRVTILRDGRRVGTFETEQVDRARLITLMTGREFHEVFPALAAPRSKICLRVHEVSVPGRLAKTSFEVREGEILGLAGLDGSGKTELGRALFGVQPGAQGTLTLDGAVLNLHRLSPRTLIGRGLMYLPADRRKEGLALCRPVLENMTICALDRLSRAGFLIKGEERQRARAQLERLRIKTPSLSTRTAVLSGGTQQKVMVSKALLGTVKVFVFDELTQGIDVAAKVDLYHFVRDLAASGAAIIMVLSDMAEILNLCHRVLILCRGEPAALLSGAQISEAAVLRHYFGEKMQTTENAASA